MKKFIVLVLLASLALAKTESDVALTVGYNKFDDPEWLYKNRNFYGIRAGIYQDDRYGFQAGYEYTNSANCQGLKLKRFYTNALIMTKLENGLKPYALGTLGYETSSKVYRPSQAFVGIGGGLKYDINENFNLFLETRALKSLKSEDITIATTLGVGYRFNTATIGDVSEEKVQVVQKHNTKVRLRPVAPIETLPEISQRVETPRVNAYQPALQSSQDGYYVQVEALTTSSAQPMLRKLRKYGVRNSAVKKMENRSLVVVGPYQSRGAAARELSKLKAVSAGAFIKKF